MAIYSVSVPTEQHRNPPLYSGYQHYIFTSCSQQPDVWQWDSHLQAPVLRHVLSGTIYLSVSITKCLAASQHTAGTTITEGDKDKAEGPPTEEQVVMHTNTHKCMMHSHIYTFYNAIVQVLILKCACHLNVTFYLHTFAAAVMNSLCDPW